MGFFVLSISMYHSYKFINPSRLSTFGFLLFSIVVLLNSFLAFFLGQEGGFFTAIINQQSYIVPIYILLLLFLLNRWFGHLILLDTEGRSVFRLVFPSLLFTLSFADFTHHLFLWGTSFTPAIEFIIQNLSSVLFLILLLGSRADEQSPSLMIALGLLLASLSAFTPKLLLFTPIIFYLLYELKSFSWRNIFAFLWGILLVPLFLCPYLWYMYKADIVVLFYDWLRPLTHFNFYLELNYLALTTMFLIASLGQTSYSINSSKLSIAQRMYLSTCNTLMWFSFIYLLFLDSTNTFVVSLFVLCSSLSVSRAVIRLSKKLYYVFLFILPLLILSNIFFLNY